MVVLSRIYTRTGDDGTTGLGDFSRTAKTDVRLAAYADVDETGAAIGVAVALLVCGNWMLHELVSFTTELYQRIPTILTTG